MAHDPLDMILAIQITTAWAGEGHCEPRRLGWWQSDLIDRTGGGDLFSRLLPKTSQWASLEAVREIARRSDERSRQKLSDSDNIRTLFYLGFETDEHLSDRLKFLVRSGHSPEEALPFPLALTKPFSKEVFEKAINPGGAATSYRIIPGGRQLKGEMPLDLNQAVLNLAAALCPCPDQYPMPFYKVK